MAQRGRKPYPPDRKRIVMTIGVLPKDHWELVKLAEKMRLTKSMVASVLIAEALERRERSVVHVNPDDYED